MYFESHAHYNDERFDSDRDELLGKTLKEAGIDYVVNIGADMPSSEGSVLLAHEYEYIYATVGVHPHEAKSMTDKDLTQIEHWCADEKVVAVGEIGLDFHYDNSPRDIQVSRFKDQLELAKRVHLPVVIHSREADELTFNIIKESSIRCEGGVIHCFSGSAEMAMMYVEMGFYIGVGGVITYSNAKKLVKVVETIPMASILLETDCPYLSPTPNRGKRNDSQNLTYICDRIAQIKQISNEEVAKISMENAFKLFRLN